MAKSESRKIKGRLILETYGYCWDGGSVLVTGKDRTGQEIEIVLAQQSFLDVPTINWYRHKIINAVNSHKYVVLSILIQRKFSRKHS